MRPPKLTSGEMAVEIAGAVALFAFALAWIFFIGASDGLDQTVARFGIEISVSRSGTP